MSTIVSKVRLVVLSPEEADELTVTKWAEQLKSVAEVLNEKRKRRIRNAEAYQKLIAEESHEGWTPFINPSFHSKKGMDSAEIKGGHLANIKRAFKLYNRKLNHAFEVVDGVPAKRFKDAVDDAKGDFSRGFAERTLPLTGDRLEGVGPAAIAGYWLVGDKRTEQYLRGGDQVLAGGPFRIIRDDTDPAFKASLAGRIIQAGANIIKMARDPSTMSRQNGLTNLIVQGFVNPALGVDPFTTGGTSHVDFIVDNDELYLEIQVSRM